MISRELAEHIARDPLVERAFDSLLMSDEDSSEKVALLRDAVVGAVEKHLAAQRTERDRLQKALEKMNHTPELAELTAERDRLREALEKIDCLKDHPFWSLSFADDHRGPPCWIVYDDDAGRVIGEGATPELACQRAVESPVKT